MSSDLKILLISNMYPSKNHPNYGVFVRNFVENMNGDKIEITEKVVIKGRGKNIPIKLLKYILFFLEVIYKGLFKKYDLIYVHFVNHTSIPVTIIKALRPQKALALNAHGADLFYSSALAKVLANFSKKLLKKADAIICPSNYFKNVLIKNFGIKEQDIFISPSAGIDLNKFRPIPKYNKPTEVFTIGYVSRIDEDKGWDDFIRAIRLIKDNNLIKNFKAIIVGDGSQRDELISLINNLNLNDYIELKGLLPQLELVEVYNSLNVFVFPTKRKAESLGLVAIEAMACGIPVIGSSNYAVTEYVKDNENGYCFEMGCIECLKEAIINYYNLSDVIIDKMKINAYNTGLLYDKNRVSKVLTEYLVKKFSVNTNTKN